MSKINGMFTPLDGKTSSSRTNDSKKRKSSINCHKSALDDDLINYTVGLVSASKYKQIKENLEILRLEKLKMESNKTEVKPEKIIKKKRVLSFAQDDDLIPNKIPVTISKDPSTCTSFLKDGKREKELLEERERLTKLFYENQNREKNEIVDIFYSYWDGNDHFKTISLPKDTSIGQFINNCIKELVCEFQELKNASCDNMIYVKQDTIIPNNMTFFDIIRSKLRGKTGPLYNIPSGENSIDDKLNAGKILDKRWYELNKHAFPACKWEKYNPHKLALKTQVLEKFK